jgi:uncharacterized protein (DUF302 family)
VDLDRLLADNCSAVLEQQRRNRVGACRRERRGSLLGLDGHLVDEVVEDELGEASRTRREAGHHSVWCSYTLSATTPLPFAEAVERVRAELKTEGFGVLCEIDVQATLREKLGVESEPYLILGACNPPLAHQALEVEPDLGVLLPCNVVIYQRGGETQISAIDPERMLSIVDKQALAPVAADVKARLAVVVERVAG